MWIEQEGDISSAEISANFWQTETEGEVLTDLTGGGSFDQCLQRGILMTERWAQNLSIEEMDAKVEEISQRVEQKSRKEGK